MGNSSALRYAGPVALAVGLLGCADTDKKRWTRDEIVDIADDSVDASGVHGEIDKLTARVNALEARVQSERKLAPMAAQIEQARQGSFDLIIGGKVQRTFSSAASCETAKQSVFQQARENCHPQAVICTPPAAYCVGE